MSGFLFLLLVTPLICTFLSCVLHKSKHAMSIIIFVVSSFSFLASILLIKGFLDIGEHLVAMNFLGFISMQLEPISLIFICMVTFLWSCTNLYSISYLKVNHEIIPTKFYFFLSISIFVTICIALAPNLVVTFIFYELLTIFTYPLVAHIGGDKECKSARIYLYMLMGASMLLFLPALGFLLAHIGHSDFVIGGIAKNLPVGSVTILFLFFLYGVAKSAIVPMHFWLPEAMVASFPVSAVLHAVAVVKSGIFIMLKISVYIFGLDYLRSNIFSFLDTNIVSVLCGLSLLISSVFAIYQTRIKLLLAYSTISQLSICLLAMSMFHPLAITAAILHMVSHAFGKITLFFASGYVYSSSKISDIKDFAGLGNKMKLIMAMFTMASLSIIGLPIFAGFISKAYIYYSAISQDINYFVLAVLSISILITADYFIKVIYIIYEEPKVISKKAEVNYSYKLHSSMTCAIILTFLGLTSYMFLYDHIVDLMSLVAY